MYIVGHCVIADMAFPGLYDVYGEDSLALMLPDVARCHEWGYDDCRCDRQRSRTGELVRIHLLTDWFIHHDQGMGRERRGWAYRRMSAYAAEYDLFYAAAAARRLHSGRPADSRRGFAHTMVEYSVDSWLIRNGYFDGKFERVRDSLRLFGSAEGTGSTGWVSGLLAQEQIVSDGKDLDGDVASFGDRVGRSRGPEEFALRAGTRKFGLADSPKSLALMAETLDRGLRRLEQDDVGRIVDAAVRFVRQQLH